MFVVSTKTWLLSFVIFLLFAGSLITSLFFKENLLWMDEILSYLLISDQSLTHLNDAIAGSFDANPPVFANLYWLIAHTISLNIVFLKAVSVVLFATTLALFYHYVTRIIGTPVINFLLITGLAAFTYLNITLSTQIRTYALFLLISFVYFTIMHRLTRRPTDAWLLIAHLAVGLLLALTHNFGLFYLAASGAFFGLLWVWSKDRRYWYVLGTFGLIGATWLLAWYPTFVIQAKAAEPHSWIPIPTFLTFFRTVGELAPTVSNRLEAFSALSLPAILRFLGVIALFGYIAVNKFRKGFSAAAADPALMLYLLAGFVYGTTILITLGVSVVHTSVFISRYLWPNHLLVIYQLVYAFYYLNGPRFLARLFQNVDERVGPERWTLGWAVSAYGLVLAGFLFYQSQKLILAPTTVMTHIAQLDKKYPVFLESSLYFIPAWFYNSDRPVNFLLDYESAFNPRNDPGAAGGFRILTSIREKYRVGAVMPLANFNANRVPRFFVVDEQINYQIERFIQNKAVRVVRVVPTGMEGIRVLECVFTGAASGRAKVPALR